MQLISLTANMPSFKTVNFINETGLNFIVATQVNNRSSNNDESPTSNGVGKSLIVALVHFCLGSSSKTVFKSKLKEWTFTLTFKIEGSEYVSSRSTENQNVIVFNGRELKIKDFKDKLEALLFRIPENVSQLSFRSLIPFFARPRKASYNMFNNPNAVKNAYQIQVTNALLLGLNIFLIEEKFKLRKEQERIKKLVSDLKNDDLLKEFFNRKKDSSIELQQIKDDIDLLQTKLNKFEVAEDYYEVNAEADKLKNELDKINNKIVLFQNQIRKIDQTLKLSPDIDKQNIENIYKEASIIIKQDALKTLDELEKFYQNLTSSRNKRLQEQKTSFQREIEDLQNQSKERVNKLDSRLRYLDAKQALDVYTKMNQKLSDLRAQEANVRRYDELIESYNKNKIKIDKKFIESTENTIQYLIDSREKTNVLNDFFRELAKRFYPKSGAGISIINNSGENQIRFDIDAKIEADASDGINNIKIFCYDLTLLLKGESHNVNFLFHDSRLLSDTDPRQIAELFKVLADYIKISGKQYNLTLNQNQLEEVKQYLSEEEFKTIITDNICLELKDGNPKDKLLGIQIDMIYD
ncbi:DUF2326 domain-containing protein [Halosquirtibacter laminarini]|uniref:DUF2326 domain-containing protein n=1 Tax=Halosquirtibacter laminarini TaxID=3374600 RepID=A0AC61NIV5_9BACT|nr:DUF2326 domain-containing protein [Prolixibacteraceae bacterium]